MTRRCRLYSAQLSPWYPLLTPVGDYQKEAAIYRDLFLRHDPATDTVLELGCGAGHNAFFLKKHFRMTLTDISPAMLSLSRKRNPECEHIPGDMRSLDLRRRFDAVFIHDAISYITSAGDLARTFCTAFDHCVPGGCVLLVPDFFAETFSPGTSHGGTDDHARGMRYLEWTHPPEPGGTTVIKDFAFLLRDQDGVRVEHDRHLLGLFSTADWTGLLRQTGFEAEILSVPYHQDGIDLLRIVYAKRP